MIMVDEKTIDLIKEKREILTPGSILNMLKDEILYYLERDVKVADIKRALESELGFEIKQKTLYNFVKKLKEGSIKTNNFKRNEVKTNSFRTGHKSGGGFDPWAALKGLQN